MSQQSSNKTIAKNTIFLYFRMMFTMVVTLFTSRVILQVLGVEDFGILPDCGRCGWNASIHKWSIEYRFISIPYIRDGDRQL